MKNYFSIAVFSLLVLLSFGACGLSDDDTIMVLPLEKGKTTEQKLYSEWTTVNSGKSAHLRVFYVYDDSDNLKEKVNVLSLNKNKFIFEIQENTNNPLTVNAWHLKNSEALAVINGSFFDEKYKATGGLWLNGQGKIISLSGQNQYDGAVLIDGDGKLSLRYLPQNSLSALKDEEQVLVNFPMMVSKGKSLLKNKEGESSRRSLIAEDDQFIYFINTSGMHFSLYQIMVWVKENIDGVENVLNLDGGSSSGLSVKGELLQWQNNSFVNVPNVIFVYEKK